MEQQEILRYIHEVFDASLPRLGPGNTASTTKALKMLIAEGHPLRTRANGMSRNILDIGCGNGGQTVHLAKHLEGIITALDNHRPYLTELMRRAETEGVADRIRPYEKDMSRHGLDENSFHLIWSEGSLFVVGFKNGLSLCRDLLVPGGLMAVTEMCWLKKDVPGECRRFFAEEYPAMTDIPTNLSAIHETGFDIAGHFTLPESAWWDNYYTPLEKRLALLEDTRLKDPKRIEFIERVHKEIDMYRKFSDFYGYVFYLMQQR